MTATTGQPATHDAITFALSGSITAYTAGPTWERALATLTRNADRPVVIGASALETIDNTGIALLFDLKRRALRHKLRRVLQPPVGRGWHR
jgi:ABC-type transporter Mla MlaB component